MYTTQIAFDRRGDVVDVPFRERVETAARAKPIRAMAFSAMLAVIVMSFVLMFYIGKKNDAIANLEADKASLFAENTKISAKSEKLSAENQKLGDQLKGRADLSLTLEREIARKKELATLYEREKARRTQAERDHLVALGRVQDLQRQLTAKAAVKKK